MFIINSIHLENFMSIEKADLEFSPNQMTAITGSNGAGKSSLLNAIAFAITGHRQGESIKDYVRTGCEESTIILNSTFKGYPLVHEITLYNSKKHPQATEKSVTYKDKTYINSDYAQFVSENKLEELESLMFMFQGSNSIVNSKPAERASLLKKLFKFEFPEALDLLNTMLEQGKMELVEHSAVVSELSSRSYSKLPLMRETAPVAIKKWESRVGEIDSALNKIGDTNEEEISSCERDLVESQKTLNKSQSRLDEDSLALSKAQTRLQDLEKSLESRDLEKMTKDLDDVKRDLAAHEKDYATQREDYSKLKSSLDVLTYKERELSAQYDISKTGVCHACGQPVEQSHIDSLKSLLEETQREMSLKKQDLKDLGFDPRDAKSSELRKKVQFAEDSIEGYKNDLKVKESLLVRIRDLSDLITERGNSIEQLEKKVKSLREKKEVLSKMKELIREKNNLLEEKKVILEKIQTSRDNLIKNQERRESNKRLEEDQKANESRIKEINDKINETSVYLARVKKATEIIGKDLPNAIVLRACNTIEETINDIIQRVFPYCRVALKLSKGGMNLFYTPENSNGEWVPASMASGAQKMMINLSYFMSLARLSGMDSVFLDEIDASCSSENSKAIYEYLANLNLFKQVFFITHRPESVEVVRDINPNLKVLYVDGGRYEEI